MKTIYLFLVGLAIASSVFAQPHIFPREINPADTGNVSSPSRRTRVVYLAPISISVDGVTDTVWNLLSPSHLDHFIMCRTVKDDLTGTYSCKPDAEHPNRMPSTPEDFSASSKILYDDDYIYAYFDVTDNEVNDGTKNPGMNERLEIFEAPYTDSVQQKWNGNYPTYSGTATEIQKKFAYWNYLGAFKFNFNLIADGKCNISIDQKPDALKKINYAQRESSCQCGWKMKADSTGYILEVALSLKTALADSANTPFNIPKPSHYSLFSGVEMSFDMLMVDKDLGLNQVKAAWNAQNEYVWDAMLYTGKLNMCGCPPPKVIKIEDVRLSNDITFFPNPAIDVIKLTEMAASVQIVSMTGTVVVSKIIVGEVNVQNLESGIYVIIINGKNAGKFLKQ